MWPKPHNHQFSDHHYDYIIIGAGAGGGTMAYALAQTGKRVLLLERGGLLKREKENWDPEAVFIQKRYQTDETWYDGHNHPFNPGQHYYVGGNTKVYGGALLRMREQDFGEVEHIDGLSPAWPITYNEMQPYYLLAEEIYYVHGLRGVDPTEPPETAPFPHPPISQEPLMETFYQSLQKIKLNPFPLPEAIMLNEADPDNSRCIRCDTCDGYPCLVEAKADAHTACVKPAVNNYPNLDLKMKANVVDFVLDKSGKKIEQVVVGYDDFNEHYSGDNFIISCGAINSAVLLLSCASKSHPNGLANSSGMVGRNYMCHNNSAIVSVSTRRNDTHFQKTIGINDFYFGSDDWNYPLGHIQTLGKVKKEMLVGDAPMLAPGKSLEYMAEHSVGWWITSEDLPNPQNRVMLTDKGNIQLSYTPNNLEAHERLLDKLKGILKILEWDTHIIPSAVYFSKKIPIAGVAHQVGTCRMGTDPSISVVDKNCKAHDLDNLYIVDGSFFPSNSAVNPTLTIAANALRVAHHLTGKMAHFIDPAQPRL